jgi:DNA-binding response OmpR family regulator
VLRELRREHFDLPVLILTGRESLADRVRGLDAGADDYLTKPFGFAELLARMRALQRRRGVLAENVLRIADLEMDVVRHQVTRSGRPVELTPREYAVLEVLLRNATRVVSRTALLEQAWAQDFDPLTNVVEVCIARLRRKIDTDGNPPLLHTVRGSGYVLRDASLQEPAGAPETPSARVDSASRQLRG